MSCVAYNPGNRTRKEGKVSLLSEVARSTKDEGGTKVKRRKGRGKKTLKEVSRRRGRDIYWFRRMNDLSNWPTEGTTLNSSQ